MPKDEGQQLKSTFAASVAVVLAFTVATHAQAQATIGQDLSDGVDRPPPGIDTPGQFPELFETDNAWTSTTIRCRGGGGTNIGLTPPERAADRDGNWRLGFWFVPALRGYNQAPLAPGECARPDRALVARQRGEPLFRLEYVLARDEPPAGYRAWWATVSRIVFDADGQFYVQRPVADNLIAAFHANQRLFHGANGRETGVADIEYIELRISRKQIDPDTVRRGAVPDGTRFERNNFIIQEIIGYGDE